MAKNYSKANKAGEDVPIISWDTKTQRIIKGSLTDWNGINLRLNQVESDILNKTVREPESSTRLFQHSLTVFAMIKVNRKISWFLLL